MRVARKLFTAIALASLVGSFARADPMPDFKATAHRVAIVSLLGDQIEIVRISAAMSGGTFWAPVTVSTPCFNATAETAMRDRLSTEISGLTVGAVEIPRTTMMDALYQGNGFGDAGLDRLRTALAPWAARNAEDYVVILRESGGLPDENAYSKAEFFGLGLYEGKPVAFLTITVLDGKTLQPVANTSARAADWGSIKYTLGIPKGDQLATFGVDACRMIGTIVPELMDKTGL